MDPQNPITANAGTANAGTAWRNMLLPQERGRLVFQLAQALKPLSPRTQELQLFNVAKAFESSIYSRSTSKNEYLMAYSRKSAQIKRQFQLQMQMNQQNQGGTTIGGLVVDDGAGALQVLANSIQPTLQPPQPQQTANMQQQLSQQQRPMLNQQQQQRAPVQQQRPMLNQQQRLMARNIQTQHMAAAAAVGSQQVLQQQVQAAIASLNFKPNLTDNQKLMLIQRQLQQQQAQNGATLQQTPAGLFQPQAAPPNLDTTASSIGSLSAISGVPVSSPTTLHPLSVVTAGGSPVQQPSHSTMPLAGTGRPVHAGVSHSQHGAAVQLVQGMDKAVLASRVKTNQLSGLSEEEKTSIREQVAQMTPMFQRVDQLLPVFLALTSNQEATKRLMLMKYMFQDQLEALQRNEYVISLANLQKLKEQFSRYFMWVKNQIGVQAQMAGANSPDKNTLQQRQQVTTAQMAGPLKHAPLDLKLPPAKRQATGPQQSLPAKSAVSSDASSGLPVTVDLTGSPIPTTLQSAAPVRPGLPFQQQQQVIDAAIAMGLSPHTASKLTREALEAQYVLRQANVGKAQQLSSHHKAQLQALFDTQVTVAKNLASQATQQNSGVGPTAAPKQNTIQPVTTTTLLQATVDAVESNKQQIQTMVQLQQKQMQATALQQPQPQPQLQSVPSPSPIIKAEPMDLPVSKATATGSVAPSLFHLKIKEEPGTLATIKSEAVAEAKSSIKLDISTDRKVINHKLRAEDVFKKFVEMRVSESKQNGVLNKISTQFVLAPVVEARSEASYSDDEDCLQDIDNKRPVTKLKDIFRGYQLPDDDEYEFIESGDIEVDDEREFDGGGTLGEGGAIRREMSKLGAWVIPRSWES